MTYIRACFIVVAKPVILGRGVDHLAYALASEAASNGSYRSADGGSYGTGDRTCGEAARGTGRCGADARLDGMRACGTGDGIGISIAARRNINAFFRITWIGHDCPRRGNVEAVHSGMISGRLRYHQMQLRCQNL